jgi:hypothetical protein
VIRCQSGSTSDFNSASTLSSVRSVLAITAIIAIE